MRARHGQPGTLSRRAALVGSSALAAACSRWPGRTADGRGDMNEELFWSMIELLDWSSPNDEDAVVRPLVARLAGLREADIFRFDDILREKLHVLDGEKYAREIGRSAYGKGHYFSPDSFLYARLYVVASGRVPYEQARADPTRMPKDKDFEPLLYVAAWAFEKKTGKEYTHVAPAGFDTFSNKAGWAR